MMAPVVQCVERAGGEVVERPVRQLERESVRLWRDRRRVARLFRRCPAPRHENAPSERAAPAQAIDPPHGHRPVTGRARECSQKLVDIADALALHDEPAARDAVHRELDLEDVAEQSHAAEGSEEQVWLELRAAVDDFVAGKPHAQRAHMRSEAALAMVVFAMYVARHNPAERDELRARRDGREKAPRNEQSVQLR